MRALDRGHQAIGDLFGIPAIVINPMRDPKAEPRWLAIIALLAVGGIYTALPPSLIIGPRWLLLAIVIVLVVPAVISRRMGHHQLNRVLGYLVSAVITLALVMSLSLLIKALPEKTETASALLLSAAALWLTNILVFALWYWRLDAGGPHQRAHRATHTEGSFLFPQMLEYARPADERNWSPTFIDYLFIAFNTSTAFSPTDTPVLSRWAKVLTMIQASISLLIVVLLAARAVNIF